jgi:hypothetical protein
MSKNQVENRTMLSQACSEISKAHGTNHSVQTIREDEEKDAVSAMPCMHAMIVHIKKLKKPESISRIEGVQLHHFTYQANIHVCTSA